MSPASAAPVQNNPYAPPGAELCVGSQEQCWRDGRQLVLRRGADLPPRCYYCNAGARPPRRARAFSWHSPWLYLLLPVNILLYAVVALLARKTVRLHPVLCEVHRRAQRRYVLLCLALVGGGFALFPGTTPQAAGLASAGLWLSPLFFLSVIVIAAWKLGQLSASRIDADCVRLRGAGKRFLDSLPPWEGLPPAN